MQSIIQLPPPPNRGTNPSAATATAYANLVAAFQTANTNVSALQTVYENAVAADTVAAANAAAAATAAAATAAANASN